MEKSGQDGRRRRRHWYVACGVTACILAVGAVAGWYYLVGRKFWTDDRDIFMPDSAAELRQVLWTPPFPLAEPLNTPGQEYEPALSPDETELYFVRGLPGASADIYVSRRRNDTWSAPAPLAAVNTEHDELGPRLTGDGQFLLFYSDRPGGRGGYDVWAAERTRSGWAKPFNLGPAVNSKHNDYTPAPTPDGQRLFFASNRLAAERQKKAVMWRATIRQGEVGDYDLFVAERVAPTSRPTTAPATAPAAAPPRLDFAQARPADGVNTPYHEGACAVSPGGDFLYFASNRPGGAGGLDIYRCRLRDGRCGDVESLGRQINSAGNDTDPQPGMGGFAMYFSSDRDGTLGGYDLFFAESREVRPFRQPRPGPQLGWHLWALLAALALLVPLLLFLKAGGYKHLNLLQKCAFVSLMVHLMLMGLFNVWSISQEILEYVAKEAGMSVAVNLDIGREVEVGEQIRQQLTDIPAPESALARLERIKVPEIPQAAMEFGDVEVPPVQVRLASMNIPPEAPRPIPPKPAEELELPAVTIRTELPELRLDLDGKVKATEEKPTPLEPAPMVMVKVEPMIVRPRPEEVVALIKPTRPEGKPILAPAEVVKPVSPAAEQVQPTARQLPQRSLDVSPAAIEAAPTANVEAELAAAEVPAPRRQALPRGAEASPAEVNLTAPVAKVAAESIAGVIAPSPRAAAPAEEVRPEARPSVALGLDLQPVRLPTKRLTDARPAGPVVAEPPVKLTRQQTSSPHARATPATVAVPAAQIFPTSRVVLASAVRKAAPRPELVAIDIRARSDSPELRLPASTRRLRADELSAPASATERPRPLERKEPPRPRPRRPAELPNAKETDEPSRRPEVSLAMAPSPETRRPTDAEVEGDRASPRSLLLPLPERLKPGPLTSPASFLPRSFMQRQRLIKEMGGSKESEAAVAKALVYLARNQEGDGRWTHFAGRRGKSRRRGTADVALTGLATLCYLAADHTPHKQGQYRQCVTKGVGFLLSMQKPNGDLRGGGRMYAHGIATLAIAEAAAMTGNAKYRQAAVKGAQFILKAQNRSNGGWRYTPNHKSSDTSVFGWQVMALHSVQRLGVKIPQETSTLAFRWLKHASRSRHNMLAGYTGPNPTPTMTAEAVFSRILLGQQLTQAEQKEVGDYLLANPPGKGGANFYYWYYASLALMQMRNEAWSKWNLKMREHLIRTQKRGSGLEGSWDTKCRYGRQGGRIYTTALATLTLEVYYRYLPMYGGKTIPAK